MLLWKSVRTLLPRLSRRAPRSSVPVRRPRYYHLALEPLEERDVPSTLLGTLALGGQPLGEIAVNPNTDRVYVAGGFGPSPLLVVNASDPTHPALVTSIGSSGSGVTVNPATNRFYSADLYGGHVVVYDGTNNAPLASIGLGYCPGYLDVNPATNLIYVGSQCGALNDPVDVINGATNTVVGGPLGSGNVMGQVHINPTTGDIYANRGGGTRVWAPNYSFLTDLSNIGMVAANPVTNRVYFGSGSDLQVRDGSTHALLATIPDAGGTGSVAVNTVRNRLYVTDSNHQLVKVIDGATNTVVESFSLGGNITPWQVTADASKNRFYVAGSSSSGSTLFVYQDADLWTGQGATNNWSDAGNWQGGSAPNPGDALVFPSGASQLANTNDFPDGTSFYSLTFTGAGYDISGNAITLTSGMSANPSGATDTVEVNITLGTNTTFTVNTGATLILSGNLDGSGGMQLNGAGILDLAGTNTYSGATTISQGRLLLAGSLDTSSSVTVASAANLEISGTLTLEQSATLNDQGTLTVDAGGAVDDLGLLTVATSGRLTDASSGITGVAGVQVEPGAELNVQGTLTVSTGGTLDDFGSLPVASSGALVDNSSGVSGVAGIQVEQGAILANQGTTQVAGISSGTATMVVNGLMTGPLTVASQGFLEGMGSVGNLTAVNGGTVVPGLIGTIGILSAQSVNLSGGGVLYIQISGYQTPETDFSRLDTGSLALGGTSMLVLDLSGITTTGTVRGIVTDGGQTGTFSSIGVINNPFSFGDSVLYRNNNIDVTLF
jgi:autotransporter-associated beta strand protein/YVTN family beta-propeller protein